MSVVEHVDVVRFTFLGLTYLDKHLVILILIVGFPNFKSKVSIWRLLRLFDHDYAACSLQNWQSILAGNHVFAAHSPTDFAACSPPVNITVHCSWDYTQQNYDQAALENLKIYM